MKTLHYNNTITMKLTSQASGCGHREIHKKPKACLISKRSSSSHSMIYLAIFIQILLFMLINLIGSSSAQFLFTYEINQESDDNRVPKSSLFDPSSFKIVTPSQLQSSYQKLTSQLNEAAAIVGASTASSASASHLSSPVTPVTSSASPLSSPKSSLINDDIDLQSPPPPPPLLPQQQQPQQQSTNNAQHQGGFAFDALNPTITSGGRAAGNEQPPPSLLKQTTAALQSFADLFSLSSPTSPSPLSSLGAGSSHGQTSLLGTPLSVTHEQQQTSSPLGSPGPSLNQEAEARSLHEHWTQQQQRAHQQQQPTSSSIASAALNSFTTATLPQHLQQHQHNHQHHQAHNQAQPSQASYWLTANPLNGPDGNYLVQIKQQQQQPQQKPSIHEEHIQSDHPNHLVDNLLSIGQQRPTRTTMNNKPANLAQSSFLSTPTSYYPHPNPNSIESSTRLSTSLSHQHHHQHHHHHAPTNSMAPEFTTTQHAHNNNNNNNNLAQISVVTPSRVSPTTQRLSSSFIGQPPVGSPNVHQQLLPPANMPDNFPASIMTSTISSIVSKPTLPQISIANNNQHIKSAEESLISFRKQQQNQHDQQSALFAAQQQLANNGASNNNNNDFVVSPNNNQQAPTNRQVFHQPQQPASSSNSNNDIPKVSPQIYESFLLQQKDQHEKHMELLKQQQELNKLLEQKQRQQEAELKRKRKKEELELSREAKKKSQALKQQQELEQQQQQQAAARRLRLEQEEREARRRRDEENERKRADEQRRYREFLEREALREREKREREAKEAQELRRKLEEEEREKELMKIKLEKEAAELAERKRAAEIQLELKRRKEKEVEEAKYSSYLRQKEELRKLLELKQKEDEATQQQRRKQAATQQQQPQRSSSASTQSSSLNLASRAKSLAQEHKDRAASAVWGAPIRTRGVTSQSSTSFPDSPASTSTSTTTTALSTTQSAAITPASVESSGRPVTGGRGRPQRIRAVKKQRNPTDEKLIRQKIPLYSGPGQYGLYRGNLNDSTIANDLAALLDSVTLPSSTTTTSTSTTTTPAPSAEIEHTTHRHHFDSATPSATFDREAYSSSLSPLLDRSAHLSTFGGPESSPTTPSTPPMSSTAAVSLASSSAEPFFDDDVPRRQARGLSRPVATAASQQQQQRAGSTSTSATTLLEPAAQVSPSHNRQSGRFFNESSQHNQKQNQKHSTAHIGLASLPADSDNDGIPGRAGVEYPVLSAVPPTSFSCSKQPLNGYYADTETACQVVHLCQGGVQSSILCPNGTIFNQEKFSCQWWYEVNCSRAPIFYQLNDNLYKLSTNNNNNDKEATLQEKKNRATSMLLRKEKQQANNVSS